MNKLLSAILLSSLSASSYALGYQLIFSQSLSPRIANYRISVTLDPEKKSLAGKETLTWRNTSKDRVSELQFHLYLNAFKNSESTFIKESGGALRGIKIKEDGWGWIDVTRMRVQNGEDLTSKIEFIHPDDDNESDQTVFRVPLTRPVLPNQTIVLDIDFTAKLPAVFARTGFYQNFFMVGQWFPKIGVYEAKGVRAATKGGWNCHQFHANTEFYADYGTYDVDITVPRSYVVGATGALQTERENQDGTKTLYYRAEDVHDFAWTASPHYRAIEDQWQHVKIRLLMQPQRMGQTKRYLHSVKAALDYFQKWIGEYPYPNLTVVDPAYGAFGAGGMEYPTLITGASWWGMPEGLRATEAVTIHEFGHQYWYGLVANNEFEEAWLDEGINQYSETRIMDETFGVKTSFVDYCGLRIGDLEFTRSGYTARQNPKLAPTFLNAWEYKAGGYGPFTYNKTATFLTTLERMIGRPVMDEIMKTYFQRWKFKHPTTRDFVSVANEVVRRQLRDRFGKDLEWFFRQVLLGTEVCDYELTRIEVAPMRGTVGVTEREGMKNSIEEKGKESNDALLESRILVSRLGEVRMPVEILVRFEDGKELRERWDGEARWKEFRYSGRSKAIWAKVDPDQVLAIDVNLNNNTYSLKPSKAAVTKYTLKFFFWIQNLFQTVAFF